MKTVVGVLLIGLGISLVGRTGTALAGPPDDAAVKEELAKFQGTWRIVEVEENGQKLTADKHPTLSATVQIEGDKHTLYYGSQSQGTVSVKIDPTTRPRRYDMVLPPEAPDKGKDPQGIYELDGDTWKFCQDKSGKGRPTRFSGEAGTGWVLVIMKREKSAGPVNELERLRGTWVIESAEVGGEKADQFVGGKMVFTDTEHSIRAPGVPEENWPRGVHRLDPSKSPKHFDIDPKTGPNIGKTHLGIYEIDGDRCRICFADPPTDERPTEFVSKEGKRLLLFVLKREK